MNRIEDVTNYITECDEEVGKALQLELGRQRRNLELIASENIVSPAVMLAMGTVPTNKYAEGYPGKRYYGGCERSFLKKCMSKILSLMIRKTMHLMIMCTAAFRSKCEYSCISGADQTR